MNNEPTVTLRDYIESRFEAIDRRFAEGLAALDKQAAKNFEAIERSTASAKEAVDERLLRMNEFREQLNQERGQYVTRIELESIKEKVDRSATRDEVGAIKDFMNVSRGRDTVLLWLGSGLIALLVTGILKIVG